MQKNRVLVEVGRRIRVTYLPGVARRDRCSRIQYFEVQPPRVPPETQADGDQTAADAVAHCIATDLPQMPRIDELVLRRHEQSQRRSTGRNWRRRMPNVRVLDPASLGIPPGGASSRPAWLCWAIALGSDSRQCHRHHRRRVPRVLGRLTPGSLTNWHRLVRELAAAKPSVVALRSAV